MCGVIGYWPGPDCDHDLQNTMYDRLMLESRIRGTHAFGICQYDESSGLLITFRSHELTEVLGKFDSGMPSVSHARFSTSGDWQMMSNNQPIVVGDRALAFNGVIHQGTRAEMEATYGVKLKAENDGEIFLRLLESYGRIPTGSDEGSGAMEPVEIVAALDIVNSFTGSFAGVWLNASDGQLYAARNARRPLWSGVYFGALWFASTRDIFLRAGLDEEDLEEVEVGALNAETETLSRPGILARRVV